MLGESKILGNCELADTNERIATTRTSKGVSREQSARQGSAKVLSSSQTGAETRITPSSREVYVVVAYIMGESGGRDARLGAFGS